MNIPEPPKCPTRLREYLKLLRQAAMTAQPIKGAGINIDVQPEKGTVINADPCDPCPPC